MLQSSSYATKLFKIDIRNTGGMSMHLATEPFILIMFAALVYLYPLTSAFKRSVSRRKLRTNHTTHFWDNWTINDLVSLNNLLTGYCKNYVILLNNICYNWWQKDQYLIGFRWKLTFECYQHICFFWLEIISFCSSAKMNESKIVVNSYDYGLITVQLSILPLILEKGIIF